MQNIYQSNNSKKKLEETILEDTEGVNFSFVLSPKINFLSSKQNRAPKIDA